MSPDPETRLKQLAFWFGLALAVCFFLPWLDLIYPTSSLHAWDLAARVPRAGKLNAYFYLVAGLLGVVLATSVVSHETRATGLVVLGLGPFILIAFVGLGSMGPGGAVQMTAIPFLLFNGTLLGVIDTHLWGTWLIWISAVLTVWSMVYYLQKALPEIRARSR